MTIATKKATVEEYMDLLEKGNEEALVAFIGECFGTEDDYDDVAATAFADEVNPLVQELRDKMIKEAANDSDEAAESEVEAAEASE